MNKEKLLEVAMLIFNPPLYFAYRKIKENIDNLEGEIRQLERNVDAHEHEAGGGEPIPPNPETATPEEIEAYKKAVREAGSTPLAS